MSRKRGERACLPKKTISNRRCSIQRPTLNANPSCSELERLTMWRCLVLLLIACCGGPALADQAADGKALLEANCSRCHAVAPGAESSRKEAPNLSIILQSYPAERLQSELSEGIRPRHPEMPQVRFSPSEIADIYYYLHGKTPESEYRRSQ
jgi:cytochrome c553